MAKIVFDENPDGTFSLSSEVHLQYFKKKYNKNIYFYTRNNSGEFCKVNDLSEFKFLKSRVMTFVDLGDKVSEIPFDNNIRVVPLDERLESDEILIDIVSELKDLSSWRNSKIKVVEI